MGKVKKVLVVQPHSDDALFSCAHALLQDDFQATVLTVENDPVRVKEDIALFNLLEIPYKHLNVEFKDESYYGYFKRYKTVNHDDAIEYLKEYYGETKLEEIHDAIQMYVKKFKKDNPDYKIIAPLGISHPFHYFVHLCLKHFADYFYREFPHSYKKRSKKQMDETLQSYKLYQSVETREIHDLKFDLAKKFYKSQSGLLFYERGYIEKQLAEEIYVQK